MIRGAVTETVKIVVWIAVTLFQVLKRLRK